MRGFPLASPAGLALLPLRGPAAAGNPATTQWVLTTATVAGRGEAGLAGSLRITASLTRAGVAP